MTSETDAHMIDLLASYQELLKVTARAIALAEALAAANAAGVAVRNMEAQRTEIANTRASVARLEALVVGYKSRLLVH